MAALGAGLGGARQSSMLGGIVGGATSALITGYNAYTGMLSGASAPNALVIVSVAGAYAASTVASAQGQWSVALSNAGGKLVSVTAVPVGSSVLPFPATSNLDPANTSSTFTLSNNNFTATTTAATISWSRGTQSRTSGLLYFESTLVSGTAVNVGVANSTQGTTSGTAISAANYAYLSSSASGHTPTFNGSATSADSIPAAAGDVTGVALNFTAGNVQFYLNGVAKGAAKSIPTGALYPMIETNVNSEVLSINLGQAAFAYTPPSGFSPWG